MSGRERTVTTERGNIVEPIRATVKNLYFRRASESRVTGSVWKTRRVNVGFINTVCGCSYEGVARAKAKTIEPGDVILITDYSSEMIDDNGNSFERITIRDFDIIRKQLFESAKTR